MTSLKQENMTRRRFCENVTRTALGCACLPAVVSAASAETPKPENEEKPGMTGSGKEHLAAACGTWCGACPAYLAKHGEGGQGQTKPQKRPSAAPGQAQKGVPDPRWMDGLLCDGCLSGGTLAGHCRTCAIRLCAKGRQQDARCTDCGELPCHRVTNLIRMGDYLHRKEYLPNLKKIGEMGVEDWARMEEARWRCPRCGRPMSWYDAECAGCGAPRSGTVFALPAGLDPS